MSSSPGPTSPAPGNGPASSGQAPTTTPSPLAPEPGSANSGPSPTTGSSPAISRWTRHTLPLLLLFGLTLFHTDPLVRTLTTRLLGDPGDARLVGWILSFGADRIAQGDWAHLFQGNIHYPVPNTVALSEHLYGISVFLWPVYAWTRNPVLLVNLSVLLALFLTAVGTYFLALDLTRHRAPAVVAAIVFAFGPAHLGRLGHAQLQYTHAIPFALMFLFRYLKHRRLRDWHWFLAFVWLQAMSGYYLFFALLLAVLAVGVVRLFAVGADLLRRGPGYAVKGTPLPRAGGAGEGPGVMALAAKRGRPPRLALLAGLLVVSIALVPFVQPYLEVNRLLGIENSLERNIAGSAVPLSFLTPPGNNLTYANWGRQLPQQPMSWEKSLFPGFGSIALFAALPLILLGQRRKPGWQESAVVALVLVGALAALGPQTVDLADGWTLRLPYAWLFDWVPGFKALRVPARMAVLCDLGIALAAGMTLAAITGGVPRRRLAICSISIGIIVFEQRSKIPTFEPPASAKIPDFYRWLAQQPAPTPLLELPFDDGYDYEWFSILHGKPIVNGKSGHMPGPCGEIAALFEREEVPVARAVGALRDLGIQLLVLHADRMDADAFRRLSDQLAVLRHQPARRFGQSVVYRFRETTRDGPMDLRIHHFVLLRQPDPQAEKLADLWLWLEPRGKTRIRYEPERKVVVQTRVVDANGASRQQAFDDARLPVLMERGGRFGAHFVVSLAGLSTSSELQLEVTLRDATGATRSTSLRFDPRTMVQSPTAAHAISGAISRTFWREKLE